MTIAIGELRRLKDQTDTRDDILSFLNETSALPPEAAVLLTETSISLLVDDDENVLAFR